ncbi:LysR family transcriptional regulator, chromosome initiation inhibitor [Micromonospora phaseoli]|uniref:HTH-type transcriptional regulator LysG n=1 Tax=Micromonospora phaseoli TaxID=1144548 RepID=A0A1H6ZUK5_9ACTN|nr:LysR family transcriptional regulator ArgP [Micromonospora phaseoli]PZV97085.1 LysR family transcriptional regulator [Micromonospora phaseoli]GIJ77335.1 transcriptional regulator ArgP [Micromonospora phaseoli]SEJ55277.1 LysR family transcriptional regulator, chromosome initiation inhibitor [Micromonospora phaseoli]
MNGLDSTQLRTLAAVVAEGSFEAAARLLHVTPSAVSQRIKALEETVGQVLVRRHRPCDATEAGRPLLRLAGQFALLEREALADARGPLGGDRGRTRVAIVVNADSLATWFPSALARLPEAPELSFDLRQDDQDHTAELLRGGVVTAAVTAQREAVQGCRVRRLGAMRYRALAAPGMVQRWFAAGGTRPAFAAAPVIVFDRKDRIQHRFMRSVTGRALDPPVHYVPSVPAFNEAIRLGLGWGLVAEQIADADLAAGRCVDVAPGRVLDVPLYWQHWRLDSPVLTAVTTAVCAVAAEALR